MSNIQHEQPPLSMIDLQTIFTHFSPQDIEGFYQLYQLWILKQRREEIVAQMHALTQQIVANEAQLKATSPSTLALATLSQFRASGVDDIDLLDRMLERGDQWLDHTVQLFERCEQMDMIQGNATEWCEHALEGAYEWIESMSVANEKSGDSDNPDDDTILDTPTTSTDEPVSEVEVETLPETTEEDFLQKLMSEDGEAQEQPDETEVSDEQQAAPEIEIEPAIPAITIDNDDESSIHSDNDGDELVSQESDEEDHSHTIDETLLTEEMPAEPLDEQTEPEDQIPESILAQGSEHEEIEYAIPARSSEVLQEDAQIEPVLQDQSEILQQTEQDDDTAAQSSEHANIEDAILDAPPESQQESESPEIAPNNQIENISSIEEDSTDENLLQSEDSTDETIKKDREDTLETLAVGLNESDIKDIAREDTIETPSFVANELDIENIAQAEEVSEPQEDTYVSNIADEEEEGETQQIKALFLQPVNNETRAFEQGTEQIATNVAKEDTYPAEPISSLDEQASHQQEDEDLTEENGAEPLQTTGEISAPVSAITPDTDDTVSLAAIESNATVTNIENEQEERGEYVRAVALAEAASELENNVPAGLAAPDIEDILPPAPTNNEAATPLKDNESGIEQQADEETQKTDTASGQQDTDTKEEEKKPQKQKQPKPRGFLRRLLAKLLYWR